MKPVYCRGFVEDLPSLESELLDLKWFRRTETREEYFMAFDTLKYTYGQGTYARTYESMTFTPMVIVLMEKLNRANSGSFDICFLNKYNSHKEHLGWHSDDSPEIDSNHPIAVVSIGAEREIWIRKIGEKGEVPKENRYLLESGSLFLMPAGFQQIYQHKIPKHSAECSWRISLTFRKYVEKCG